MDKVQEFIDGILSHAESRYDPVKAHEYYLKTRELQGRSASALGKSTKKKEGWAYVKGQVGEERKGALKSASETNKEAVAKLHESAKVKREEISEKLKVILGRITEEGTATREQISKETQSKIDALPEMPKNLNKQQRAEFAEKRREEVAKIRGEASGKREDVSTFTKAWRKGEHENVAGERAKVVEEVKASLEGAKQNYEKAKEALKAKYESELDTEFEAIRNNQSVK